MKKEQKEQMKIDKERGYQINFFNDIITKYFDISIISESLIEVTFLQDKKPTPLKLIIWKDGFIDIEGGMKDGLFDLVTEYRKKNLFVKGTTGWRDGLPEIEKRRTETYVVSNGDSRYLKDKDLENQQVITKLNEEEWERIME